MRIFGYFALTCLGLFFVLGPVWFLWAVTLGSLTPWDAVDYLPGYIRLIMACISLWWTGRVTLVIMQGLEDWGRSAKR